MALYTVTTTTDSDVPNDTFLSLREAIAQANATTDNDQIIFDSSVFLGGVNTTISLASALPAIAATSGAGSLTITGNGASRLTVNANLGNFSVFSIASGGNLTISGVTVTGANNSSSGGGFFNDGTLIITDCSIGGNAAANGGGIYQDEGNGTFTVTNSTFSGNNSLNGVGGGIYNGNSRTGTVTNSTISGNNSVFGGGIFNSRGTLTLSNSTIWGNTASIVGGGIYDNFGTINIANTIIGNNGSIDILDGGTVNLIGSATAANNLVSTGSYFPNRPPFSWATTRTPDKLTLDRYKITAVPPLLMRFWLAVVPSGLAI